MRLLRVLSPDTNERAAALVGRTTTLHPHRFIMERPALQARMFVDRSPCG
jgi:hypothetical protein